MHGILTYILPNISPSYFSSLRTIQNMSYLSIFEGAAVTGLQWSPYAPNRYQAPTSKLSVLPYSATKIVSSIKHTQKSLTTIFYNSFILNCSKSSTYFLLFPAISSNSIDDFKKIISLRRSKAKIAGIRCSIVIKVYTSFILKFQSKVPSSRCFPTLVFDTFALHLDIHLIQ